MVERGKWNSTKGTRFGRGSESRSGHVIERKPNLGRASEESSIIPLRLLSSAVFAGSLCKGCSLQLLVSRCRVIYREIRTNRRRKPRTKQDGLKQRES